MTQETLVGIRPFYYRIVQLDSLEFDGQT
jgi:hypothetical protein